MKRYRVLVVDFDTRAYFLTAKANDTWSDETKEVHERGRRQIQAEIIEEFGAEAAQQKLKNFADLGPKPFSILAFHNRFLHQARVAFVMSAYYPALTGACSLGERILNHLIITLRDDYKASPEYKRVYDKNSFDNWNLAIETLSAWDVLLPNVIQEFQSLRDRRNDAIHFRPETDKNDRELALAAIKNLNSIIGSQFSAGGQEPWFIPNVPGECYIKKSWENKPFIRKIYFPNCHAVGPSHTVENVNPWRIRDETQYEQREISDDEFCSLRQSAIVASVPPIPKTQEP